MHLLPLGDGIGLTQAPHFCHVIYRTSDPATRSDMPFTCPLGPSRRSGPLFRVTQALCLSNNPYPTLGSKGRSAVTVGQINTYLVPLLVLLFLLVGFAIYSVWCPLE